MRSFKRATEEGRKIAHRRNKLDIGAFEVHQLKERYKENPTLDTLLDIIVDSYSAGLAIGYRNA